MPIADIVVPQMGEGLREVRIVALSKKPGEHVRRDETIYTMETDKALLEVESAYEGTLVEWLVKLDDVLEIGAPVARIETDSAATDTTHSPAASRGAQAHPNSAKRNDTIVPPRTRKYLKDLGIDETEMRSIPAPSGKLLPADVVTYLAARGATDGQKAELSTTEQKSVKGGIERTLSAQQRLFNYRARRSAQMVIPVTIGRPVNWAGIAKLAADKSAGNKKHVTEFQAFAYYAASTAAKFPKLRSILVGDDKVVEFPHINLGVAAARENGDLLTALVPAADTLPFDDFTRALHDRVHDAREGKDQATPDMQFVLTYLGKQGVTFGTPLLVAPAVAILFIGAATEIDGVPTTDVALTFDHRLINGAEAAEFLAELAEALPRH